MTANQDLERVLQADMALRAAEKQLLAHPPAELSTLLEDAVAAALSNPDAETSMARLMRLADLCAQTPHPRTIDALLEILNHDEPAVRAEAGECLLHVAYERIKEVAEGVERVLEADRGGPRMVELPFMLCDVRDPDMVPLLLRFLESQHADVVAAGIEALVAYGDPAAARHIEALVADRREATLDDLDAEPVSVGDLASDALLTLQNGDGRA